METITLTGEERKNFGKKWAKKIRSENKTPCVLYSRGKNIHFAVEEKNINTLIFTSNTYIVDLNIGKTKEKAILKDTQFHPVEDNVLHVDFVRISEKEPVEIAIPVRVKGISIGVKNGGNLVMPMKRITARGLLENLPDYLEIDITELDINDNIKIEDLSFENLELAERKNAIVAQVKMTRVALAEETEVEEVEGEEEETTEETDKEDSTPADTAK